MFSTFPFLYFTFWYSPSFFTLPPYFLPKTFRRCIGLILGSTWRNIKCAPIAVCWVVVWCTCMFLLECLVGCSMFESPEVSPSFLYYIYVCWLSFHVCTYISSELCTFIFKLQLPHLSINTMIKWYVYLCSDGTIDCHKVAYGRKAPYVEVFQKYAKLQKIHVNAWLLRKNRMHKRVL